VNRDKSTKRWFNHRFSCPGVADRELARSSSPAGAGAAGSHSALSVWVGNANEEWHHEAPRRQGDRIRLATSVDGPGCVKTRLDRGYAECFLNCLLPKEGEAVRSPPAQRRSRLRTTACIATAPASPRSVHCRCASWENYEDATGLSQKRSVGAENAFHASYDKIVQIRL
jgi:hypothetical protein